MGSVTPFALHHHNQPTPFAFRPILSLTHTASDHFCPIPMLYDGCSLKTLVSGPHMFWQFITTCHELRSATKNPLISYAHVRHTPTLTFLELS